MYPVILNDYLNLQHRATYAIRDLTELEERKAEFSIVPKSNMVYVRLHEVARWATMVCEILAVNIKTLEYIVQCHKEFMQRNIQWDRLRAQESEPEGDPITARIVYKTHQSLRLYSQMVYSMHCRCTSYQERMRNEIQLVFNVMAQNEARASVAIAKATKADSEAMKATSFIALVFLPPTFVSAIFSTSFFQFGDDSGSWHVSNQFWLYWAVVLPVTFGCLFLWYGVFFKRKRFFMFSKSSAGDRSSNIELSASRNVDSLC
jgi:hypothetical protein